MNTGYTIEEYYALKRAYATGARSTSYGGESVTYGSREEMRQILREMEAELGINGNTTVRIEGQFSKGFNNGCENE